MPIEAAGGVLARNLGRMLEFKRMGQSDLARRSGVSRRMIGYVLNNQHSPTVKTVEALARALGVPLWALFVEDMIPHNGRHLNDLVSAYFALDTPARSSVMHFIRAEAALSRQESEGRD